MTGHGFTAALHLFLGPLPGVWKFKYIQSSVAIILMTVCKHHHITPSFKNLFGTLMREFRFLALIIKSVENLYSDQKNYYNFKLYSQLRDLYWLLILKSLVDL